MTDANSTPRPATALWVKVVLALSLTFNLLVVGLVVGAKFGDDDRRPDRRGHSESRTRLDPALGPFARALPEEERREAMRALEDRSGPMRPSRAELATQLADMLAVLRAEPYDADALRSIFAEQRAGWNARSDTGREIMLEKIEAMTLAERAEFADRIERGFRRAIDRSRHDDD